MNAKRRRWLGINRDRDLLDWITLAMAFVALLTTIAMPLLERYLEGIDETPQVAISGKYLYTLSPKEHEDILFPMLRADPTVRALGSAEENASVFNALLYAQRFKLIRMRITNMRNAPMSLNTITPHDLNVEGTNDSLRISILSLYGRPEDGRWQKYPVLNVPPNSTTYFDLVVGFTFAGLAIDPAKLNGADPIAQYDEKLKYVSIRISASDVRGGTLTTPEIPFTEQLEPTEAPNKGVVLTGDPQRGSPAAHP